MNDTPQLPDYSSLSLEEQVAQMVVVRASGYLFDHQIRYPAWEPPAAKLKHWLENLAVGGVILAGGSAGELALRSQQLQAWAKIPLLIAADIEEGVGQRFAGATWFPPPMAVGAIAKRDALLAQHYAEQMGAITAQEALAIGINWVLAPVVDVNNNPLNPVINVRAFAENPIEVSHLASAFIQGAQAYPVLTTAKHFPGHGDTAIDSHLDLPVLPHSPIRLAEIELPPFAAAIAAGTDAVMSAHLLIPAWDTERPATLSPTILTQLLRQEMGFAGLIVTDALVMGAIATRYGPNEASVLAVEAGADILLMPLDPPGAIQAVCEAVTEGRLSLERIQASLERIWKAKLKVLSPTLAQYTSASPASSIQVDASQAITKPSHNMFSYQLAQQEALSTSASLLQNSQLVRGTVPLPARAGSLLNLIVVDDALSCNFLGQHTPAIAVPKQLGYQLQLVDCHTPAIQGKDLLCPTSDTDPTLTLLQLFIRGNPFRGSAGLTPVAAEVFKILLRNGKLQALVIYGSPYALDQFLPSLSPETTCIFSYGQMPDAQAIAMEVLLGS